MNAALLEVMRGLKVRPASGVTDEEARATAQRLEALQSSGMRLTESQVWVLKCCRARVYDKGGSDDTAARKEAMARRVQAYAEQHGLSLDDGAPQGAGA